MIRALALLVAVFIPYPGADGPAEPSQPPAPVASAPGPAAPGATGVIEGVLQLRDRPARRTVDRYGARGAARPVQVIPAVVFLRGRVGTVPEPEVGVEMTQADTAFVPPLLVVPVGTRVAFPNGDPFFHNVFSYSRAGRFDLGRYPRGESKAVSFDEPGIVKVYCEVHESMRAGIVVVENQYWAEPAPDGTFRITGVPAGTYTLVAWQADRGDTEVQVTVRDGAVTRVEVEL